MPFGLKDQTGYSMADRHQRAWLLRYSAVRCNSSTESVHLAGRRQVAVVRTGTSRRGAVNIEGGGFSERGRKEAVVEVEPLAPPCHGNTGRGIHGHRQKSDSGGQRQMSQSCRLQDPGAEGNASTRSLCDGYGCSPASRHPSGPNSVRQRQREWWPASGGERRRAATCCARRSSESISASQCRCGWHGRAICACTVYAVPIVRAFVMQAV